MQQSSFASITFKFNQVELNKLDIENVNFGTQTRFCKLSSAPTPIMSGSEFVCKTYGFSLITYDIAHMLMSITDFTNLPFLSRILLSVGFDRICASTLIVVINKQTMIT